MNKGSRWKALRISTYLTVIITLLILAAGPLYTGSANTDRPLVYVIPIEDTVEKGLYAFLSRGFIEAEEAGADHIIIDMDTYGGAVDAANDIGILFQRTDIPITVFVNPYAISAGAYIALNADQIVMHPSASMGAATVVNMEGSAADAKSQSVWITNMTSAAENNDRDPLYAEAMVDQNIQLEGLPSPLTFTASQAMEYGYAEAIAVSLPEVLTFLELEQAEIREVEISFAEQLARFITHPIVASILLSLASLGLVLELYSPGFGVPGTIGLASLLLFFFGHMVAGFAGWESVIILVIGLVLIILELFTAGFGLFGILGIVAVGTSIALASVDVVSGLKTIGISLIITIIVMIILGRYLNNRGIWKRLIMEEELSTVERETQYKERSSLIGKEGVALNMLRPSGSARINGKNFDVVSTGRSIPRGAKIKVEDVSGNRILVSEIEKE